VRPEDHDFIEDTHTEEPQPFSIGRLIRRIRRRIKKRIKALLVALGKRSPRFQAFYRSALKARRVRNWQMHLRHEVVSDKVVVFECFRGRSYMCSPKAIYRAMLADHRFDDFEFVWAFKKPGRYLEHPDMVRATLVRYGSQEFYRQLARARHWVFNSRIPEHIDPRAGQIYVQTWHGTPLKRIGCDLSDTANALYSEDEIFRQYDHDGRGVTFFLSPSAFASEKFITAFNLHRRGRQDAILEVGYPRNDFLATHTTEDVARVRAELDIPEDRKVVLYAPTWRDNQHRAGVGFVYDLAADFDRMREVLGEEYVILFRAHYLIANSFDFERYDGFVRNVSKVDDINDLYIVSDLLVTDYSSVFFDYANLRRPIVFYMYDLAEYAEDIRGFYLDLSELPGPIVRTEADLIEAIRTSVTSDPSSDDHYRHFLEKFAPLDDGHASERVIERMLAEPSAS
jgi:CDP-glycerol glycerophosphotransferase